MLDTIKKCKAVKRKNGKLKYFKENNIYRFRTNRLFLPSTILRTYYIWLYNNMLYIINRYGTIIRQTNDLNYLGDIIEINDDYIKIDFKPEFIATKNAENLINDLNNK